MIDLQNETPIRLRDCRNLPWLKGRSGGRLSVETLHRWALRSCHGVLLDTARVGTTLYTTERAVLRFVESLSVTPGKVQSTEQKRAATAANKLLDNEGIV